MPTYKVTDPTTGKTFRLTGEAPPTEAELNAIFSAKQQKPAGMLGGLKNIGLEAVSGVNRGVTGLLDYLGPQQINAALELAGTDARVPYLRDQPIVQGATTGQFMEPGLGRDIVRTGSELVGPAVGMGRALQKTAQAIPKLTPSMETTGQAITRQLGQTAPRQEVTGAYLAGTGMETGGEIGEAVGGDKGRQVGEMVGAFALPVTASVAANTVKTVSTPKVKKMLSQAAPSIENLKSTAREVYKEIDDLGVVIRPGRINQLGQELRSTVTKEGFHPKIHPKINAALDAVDQAADTPQSLTNVDTLRRIAGAAAKSNEPDERRLGSMLTSKIDDFLDNIKPSELAAGKGSEVGAKYRDARQLWQRAKKGEILADIFENAKNQATGFENGLRTQFRSLLKNKKQLRGFTKDEISAMTQIVRGGKAENLAKLLGKFGYSEGQAARVLMPTLGMAIGGFVAGGPGAVAVPIIGQVSRGLAQKLTANNARLADAIVRAGNKGTDVVRAYLKSTPPSERNVEHLTELLIRPEVSLGKITLKQANLPEQTKKLVSDAAYFAATLKGSQEESQ